MHQLQLAVARLPLAQALSVFDFHQNTLYRIDRLVAMGYRLPYHYVSGLSKAPETQPESRLPSMSTQPGIDTTGSLAESAASAPCRVHPIPIHPPR